MYSVLFNCWKLGPRWIIYNNVFLSHSYILIFLLKSLFTITLILICITVSHHIVRKSFLFPLHCIALQEKCHFLTTTTYCSALFQTVIVQMRVLEGEDEVSVEQTVNSEFLELTSWDQPMPHQNVPKKLRTKRKTLSSGANVLSVCRMQS